MNNIKMIPRGCSNPLCDQVFKVSQIDFTTKFHSDFCKNNYEQLLKRRADLKNDPRIEIYTQRKSQKCLDMVNSEKMEECGMEDGELKSNLKEEESNKEKEKVLLNTLPNLGSAKEESIIQIQQPKKHQIPDPEQTTTRIEAEIFKEDANGEGPTKRGSSLTKGNTMQETNQLSGPESMKTGLNESPLEGSKLLSIVLKEEKENSIQSLNESSKLLTGLARSMMQGKKDEDGEFIQKPMINDVEMALRCLEGARNIQKTKLDFLKFGYEISRDSK